MNISTLDHETIRQAVLKTRPRGWLFKHRWLALFVGVPTLLAIVYYGFIASPIYVSQSTFVIKSPGKTSVPSLSLANLVQSGGLAAGKDQTQEVLQYIRSRNGLRDLAATTDIRAKFERRGADLLSRLPVAFGDRSFESLYRFYGSMVSASLDPDSGLAVVETRAFTARDAYQINAKLLDLSEALVNRLNDRAQTRAVTEAAKRVDQAQQRVREARLALTAYRNRQDLVDPKAEAEGILDVTYKLIAERAALQAQLDTALRVAPRNPSIPALRDRVAAISRQIGAQTGRAVGTPTGIASKATTYEQLSVDQEIATQMLTAAQASLEQARTEAQKQQFYLERVVEPNMPDDALLPHRFKRILVVFAVSLCLYFIGWMLVVGILEHAPED
jgi:capsular polysaccharide transport system permease protein